MRHSADDQPTDAGVRVLSSGHSLLEGPRWRDDVLYASDFFSEKVLAFREDGTHVTVCEVPGRPSGLGWTPAGDLLVVSMKQRRLLRHTPEGLVEVADLSSHVGGDTNDMAVDDEGRAYIGNFGWDDEQSDDIEPTHLLRVDPDGSVHIAAEDVVFPNGIVISDDGRLLVVAETFAARITAYVRHDDGTLSGRRVWADLSGGRTFTTVTEAVESGACLPDGIAFASDGTLWVADAARQGVLRVAEGGEIVERIPLGEQTAYAVAVGGRASDQLFICAAVPFRSDDPSRVWSSRLLVRALS